MDGVVLTGVALSHRALGVLLEVMNCILDRENLGSLKSNIISIVIKLYYFVLNISETYR